jgi:hypothetical protein
LAGKSALSNPDITVDALFLTIAPAVTAFHRGTTEICKRWLVQRCKTDGELAAVLCNELAKMTVEAQAWGKPAAARAAIAHSPQPAPRRRSRSDPTGRTSDLRKELTRRPVETPPEQDPNALARDFLTKAGFSADDLTKASVLIRQAESNPAFNQMITSPRSGGLGIPK